MPTSTDQFKDAIFAHVKFIANYNRNINILDVGAGYGTFAKGVPDIPMDGLEIHQPYIDEYDLRSYYRNVFCADILNFDYSNYDYLILGDVLEHIKKDDGIKLIKDIEEKKIKCLVGVPFEHPQGTKFNFLGKDWDVESEIHHQPDLTPRIMQSRYPSLEVLLMDPWRRYAYYTNYHKWTI